MKSGGGTFDAAIVSISSMGIYHVRSTSGNTRLGGAKFVNSLMRHGINKYKHMINKELDSEDIALLRVACENAKTQLSTDTEAKILIDEHSITIKRDEYEGIITPLVDKTMQCVTKALEDSDLEKEEIHKIVLVGGGTFTPLVRAKLESFFGKPVNTDINPMEAGNFPEIY